jgi:hypothetical protein
VYVDDIVTTGGVTLGKEESGEHREAEDAQKIAKPAALVNGSFL